MTWKVKQIFYFLNSIVEKKEVNDRWQNGQ
jgi:hypothetical protein